MTDKYTAVMKNGKTADADHLQGSVDVTIIAEMPDIRYIKDQKENVVWRRKYDG